VHTYLVQDRGFLLGCDEVRDVVKFGRQRRDSESFKAFMPTWQIHLSTDRVIVDLDVVVF
jgi:hypothetical protein